MSIKYLETFFDEKQIPFQVWSLTDSNGQEHVIDNDVVKDVILTQCGADEQAQIASTLRKIDFHNGDINHFLKHLAQGLVNNW